MRAFYPICLRFSVAAAFALTLQIPLLVNAEQTGLPRISAMPDIPSPYSMRDWKKTGRDYIRFVLDESKTGEHLPVLQWLPGFPDGRMAFIPSYPGLPHRKTEAINAMAMVVTGSLLGIDMRDYNGTNFVDMVTGYFYCSRESMYGNDKTGCGVTEFWYKMLPNLLFHHICALYPDDQNLQDRMLQIADRLVLASQGMGGNKDPWKIPEFEHWSFDFDQLAARNDRDWKEAGAAGAFAWMGYAAYLKSGNQQHLNVADWAMEYLSRRDLNKNPIYEVVLRYAPLTAARMNAELGREYDLHKFLLWCTGVSDTRYGWGVISGPAWGEYDCDGLAGSTTDTDGYAFAMNTFQAASTSVPVVRYNQQYANAIGKWMLNLINAARLFYGNALPAELQDNKEWLDRYDPDYCLAYEGLRHHSLNGSDKRPYATGDAIRNGFPNNIGLYGSSHVGYLASLVETTNVEKILQLDCLATDFFHGDAYPTYLYYNPFPDSRIVKIDTGGAAADLYDTVSHSFLARNVDGLVDFDIASKSARVLVIIPAGGTIRYQDRKMLVNDIVVDYQFERGESGVEVFERK